MLIDTDVSEELVFPSSIFKMEILFWTRNMEEPRSSEKSINIYQSAWCHIPDDYRIY
jgi:hypothetical protein